MSNYQDEPDYTGGVEAVVDYHADSKTHSDIIYTTAYPNIQSYTLNVGGTYLLEWLLPPQVFTMSKCSYDGRLAATGLGGGTYLFMDANLLTHFTRIKVIDGYQASSVWLDCSNIGQTFSALVPACTRLSTFLTKSYWQTGFYTTTAGSSPYPVEDIIRFMPQFVFSAISATAGATTNGTPVATLTLPTNYAATCGASSVQDMYPFNTTTQRKQYYIDTTGLTTGATNYLDFSIPFSAFKGTVLSVDKLMYNPANIKFQMWYGGSDTFAFSSQSTTNPSSTCASLPASTITISNIRFTIASENNPQLYDLVFKSVTGGGLSFPIPFLSNTQSSQTALTQSIPVPLTNSYGDNLLALIFVPNPTSNSGSTAYQYNAHSRGYITLIKTNINGVSRSNGNGGFDCTLGQDYSQVMRKFLRGSAVQSAAEFAYGNYMYIESFYGNDPLWSIDFGDVDGRNLNEQNQVYNFIATLSTAQSLTWLIIFLTQKTLHLTSQGSAVY